MLDNGKSYHIKLLPPWNLEFEAMIVGLTTPQNMADFGTFDIKGQYFDRYNIGMAHYTSIMRDTTQIYMCKVIESRNPIVLKEAVSLYIPSPLVDESATIELLSCVDISFALAGAIRHFTGPLSEGEFLNTTESAISAALRTVDNLLGDAISVDSKVAEALYEKPFIDNQEAVRTTLQGEARDILRFQAIEEETRIGNLVKRGQELEALKIGTANQQLVLAQRLLQLNTSQGDVEAQRRYLDKVRDTIVILIETIRSGSLNPLNFPSFLDLYEDAKKKLGG